MTAEVLVPIALAALAALAWLAPPVGSKLPTVSPPRGTRSGDYRPDAPSQHGSPFGSPSDSSGRTGVASGAAAVGAGVVVALLVGSALGVVLGAVVVPVAWRWLTRLEPAADRKRREQLEAGLPLVVDLMAACLRSGQAPESALAAVSASLEPGPLRAETAAVVARLRLGGDPTSIWRTVGRHPQLGPLGRTVARALEGGAAVSDAMDDLAQELRRTRRAEVQARARSVGARAAAPLGLCLLPAFVLVGIVPVVAGSLGALLQR